MENTIGRPIFLRRCLFKFVKGVFPQVDDCALKLPISSKSSRVRVSRSDIIRGDVVNDIHFPQVALDVPMEPDSIRKGGVGKTELGASHIRRKGRNRNKAERQVVDEGVRGHKNYKRAIGRNNRAKCRAENCRPRTSKGVKIVKLPGARRRLIQRVQVLGIGNDDGFVKESDVTESTSCGWPRTSIKLRLPIKNLGGDLSADSRFANAPNDDALLLPPVLRQSSGDIDCKLSQRIGEKHIHDEHASASDAHIRSLSRAGKRVRFADDLQACPSVHSPVKKPKCIHFVEDPPTSLSERRLRRCVEAGKKVARFDCESTTPAEDSLLIARRMSISRRLYCPPRLVAPSKKTVHVSASTADFSDNTQMDKMDNLIDPETSSSPSLSETTQGSKVSKSCIPGHRGEDGEYFSGGRKEHHHEKMQPLNPSREDMVISPICPDDNFSDNSDDMLSMGSLTDTVISDYSSVDGSESPRKSPNQRCSNSATVPSSNIRLSIDFLLCDDEAGCGNSEEQQHLRGVETSIDVSGDDDDIFSHSSEFCPGSKFKAEHNRDAHIFEVVVDKSIQPSYLWHLPKTGVAWTKAWAARHWSAHLSPATLRDAEERFRDVGDEAECLLKTLQVFASMGDEDGVHLGHPQERARLLKEFEPHYRNVTDNKPVGLLVSDGKASVLSGRKTPVVPIEAEHAYAMDFLETSSDMQYEDIVCALVHRWREVRARFAKRLEETESRQARELEGRRSISSVMRL